jgi:hypothetical protein
MLWHKGWLETRWRLVFVLGWDAFLLGAAYARGVTSMTAVVGLLVGGAFLGAFVPIMLAGAGVNTQPVLQATKGLHGSMHFTLSLPVSRSRLLAVRAGLGWLETVAATVLWSWGVWFLFPMLRQSANIAEACEYAVTLVVCASGFYSINVLLATFLDDLWRLWAGMIFLGVSWWVFAETSWPPSLNLFRAMGAGSPLITHAMPWAAMGLSAVLATAVFFASLKVVQAREY